MTSTPSTDPSSSEARALNQGRTRPALPDPQQDRHVAFPDGAPAPSEPTCPSLPPEAWAPRTADPGEWSPGVAPSILSSPPTRPAPRRKAPAWLLVLLVPPLLLGVAGNRSDDGLYGDCSSFDAGTGPGTSSCVDPGTGDEPPADDVKGVWAQALPDTTTVAPLLTRPPAVRPVPADTDSLRVEVVGSPGPDAGSPLEAHVDTSAAGAPLDSHDGTAPYAMDVHLFLRPSTLSVSATVTQGSGTLQCRVYAGERLVAVDTSTDTVTCAPQL